MQFAAWLEEIQNQEEMFGSLAFEMCCDRGGYACAPTLLQGGGPQGTKTITGECEVACDKVEAAIYNVLEEFKLSCIPCGDVQLYCMALCHEKLERMLRMVTVGL